MPPMARWTHVHLQPLAAHPPTSLPATSSLASRCPAPPRQDAPPPRLSSRLTPSASGTLFGPVSPHRASFPERRPTLPSTVTPPPGWPQALQVPSPIQETAPCLPHFLEVDGFTQQTPTGLRAGPTGARVGDPECLAAHPIHLSPTCPRALPVGPRGGCRRPGSRPCLATHRQPNHRGG